MARIKESYYVGGYNNKPTPEMIQKELLLYGPLATEFRATDAFQFYHGGVIMDQAPKQEPSGLIQQHSEEPLVVPSSGDIAYVQLD